MNKKIKVIELLNKIANGEEVPKRIKYEGLIYNWDITGYLHYEDSHISEKAFLEGYRTDMCLNDEVEILEDNTEEIEELKYDVVDENGRGWYKLDTIADKVTELIKAVNQIRKDLNK